MPTIYQDENIKIRRNTSEPIKYKAYDSNGEKLSNVIFQNNTSKNTPVNGLTNEAVIAIVIDRLKCQNQGDFKSLYNDKAIECLVAGLGALKAGAEDNKSKPLLNLDK